MNQPLLSKDPEVNILLVEDNQSDVYLFREIADLYGYPYKCVVQEDGESAYAYLQVSEQLPDIVLLDINMPKMDGHQLLKKIRADKRLKTLPVLMLTGSRSEKDIEYSKQVGANGYAHKPPHIHPADIGSFINLVHSQPDIWVHVKSSDI